MAVKKPVKQKVGSIVVMHDHTCGKCRYAKQEKEGWLCYVDPPAPIVVDGHIAAVMRGFGVDKNELCCRHYVPVVLQ